MSRDINSFTLIVSGFGIDIDGFIIATVSLSASATEVVVDRRLANDNSIDDSLVVGERLAGTPTWEEEEDDEEEDEEPDAGVEDNISADAVLLLSLIIIVATDCPSSFAVNAA